MTFSEYIWLLFKKECLDERIERIEGNLYHVHPATLSDMPRGSLGDGAGIDDDLDVLFDLRMKRDELLTKIHDIENDKDFTDAEKTLVYHKYVLGETWKDVSSACGYTERHTKRLHDKILGKF